MPALLARLQHAPTQPTTCGNAGMRQAAARARLRTEVSMRTILVNLEISPVLDSALQCALLVAQRFGSYIEGLHMRPGSARHHRRRRRRLRRRRARPGRELRARGARAGRAGAQYLRGRSWPRTACRAPRAAGRRRRRAPTGGSRSPAAMAPSAASGRVFDLLVVGRPLAGFGGARAWRRSRPPCSRAGGRC